MLINSHNFMLVHVHLPLCMYPYVFKLAAQFDIQCERDSAQLAHNNTNTIKNETCKQTTRQSVNTYKSWKRFSSERHTTRRWEIEKRFEAKHIKKKKKQKLKVFSVSVCLLLLVFTLFHSRERLSFEDESVFAWVEVYELLWLPIWTCFSIDSNRRVVLALRFVVDFSLVCLGIFIEFCLN